MLKNLNVFACVAISLSFSAPGTAPRRTNRGAQEAHEAKIAASLWRYPSDITSRNLYYGPGGKEHEPRGPFSFIKKDLDGLHPKYLVEDEDGVRWKIKLGLESRPETVATRLVWAVGYFTDEDYFVHFVRVKNMPAHLHRGGKLVKTDGSMLDARLERHVKKAANGAGATIHSARQTNSMDCA